jgi:RNA polymerase sigma-70 factor (ECF subfamily)
MLKKTQPLPGHSGHTIDWRRVPALNPADDQHDVALVLAGDTSAFEGIVRRWQSPLINLAYRFTRDRARAEDLAQEAFLRAFRNLASWRQESAFSTWLFSLATNLYCTELRRIPPIGLPFDEVPEPHDPRESAQSFLEHRHEEAAIHKAIDTLPPKYREVLLLYYFQEMDVPATASSLNLPQGTVKARLFRARDMLRAKLQSRTVSSTALTRTKELL